MPALALLGVIALIVVFVALRALVHLIQQEPLPSLLCAVIGVPVVLAAGYAVLRGAMRHTMLSVPGRPARPQLPSPAEPRAIEAAQASVSPFTSDSRTWALAAEAAEREDLYRRGPREGRPVTLLCEGPGCGSALDDEPWTVEREEDGEREEHSFCSGECAQAWMAAEEGQHAR